MVFKLLYFRFTRLSLWALGRVAWYTSVEGSLLRDSVGPRRPMTRPPSSLASETHEEAEDLRLISIGLVDWNGEVEG